MSIGHDLALHCLTENFIETNHRQLSAVEKISQHIARSNGRQLIAVAHHYQPTSKLHGLQKCGKKQAVDHRKLVDNNRVGIKLILLVFAENKVAVFLPSRVEQAVEGLGLVSRKVAHTLGGAAGWRGKEKVHSLLFQNCYNSLQRGGFSGAGAAGQNEYSL